MKTKFFTSLLIISAIFISINCRAQVKVDNHDKNSSYFSGGSGSASDEQNVIKVGTLHPFAGELPIFYERRLNNSFTVQGAVGVTFLNEELLLEDQINNVNTTADQNIGFSLGYSLKLGARYYPGNEAPEGFYLSPEIRYKVYNITYSNLTTGPDSFGNPVSANINAKVSYFDFVGMAGYQYINDFNFVYDFYAGFGGRVKNYTVINENAAGYYSATQHTALVPLITLGITVGLAF